MNATPQARIPGPWKALQSGTAGFFTARARGFLGGALVIAGSDGQELGRLKMLGDRGAELLAEDEKVIAERTQGARYRMLSDGEEILTAWPAGSSADRLEIRCGRRDYTATVGFLRNRAVARDAAGSVVARLAGNVTGRSYRIETDTEDTCGMPIAVLLLYHTVSHRRRAYRVTTGA